jgi:hypothetical protein
MQSFWKQLSSLVRGSKKSSNLFQRVRKVWTFHPACDQLEDRVTPTLIANPAILDAAVPLAGSLRYEIANAPVGATVYLMPGTYTLTAGELSITQNITLTPLSPPRSRCPAL